MIVELRSVGRSGRQAGGEDREVRGRVPVPRTAVGMHACVHSGEGEGEGEDSDWCSYLGRRRRDDGCGVSAGKLVAHSVEYEYEERVRWEVDSRGGWVSISTSE
jgi:hypothetical protein